MPEIGQESQSKLCCADFDIQLRSALLISKLAGLLLGAKQATLALREFFHALGKISHVIVQDLRQDAGTAADNANVRVCQALVQLVTPAFQQLLVRDDNACMGSCHMLQALLQSSPAMQPAAACELLKNGRCCP